MKIINTRSPFFITVDEINQVGSKIELFIYDGAGTITATPTYTLSKKISSFTQTANIYNISSFIQEYVVNVASTLAVVYANVVVKVYKETSANVYALSRTENYVAVNGYNDYADGVNKINTNESITVLADNTKTLYYYRTSVLPYVNLFVDSVLGDKLELNYRDVRGRNLVNTVLVAASAPTQLQMLKIPLSTSSIKYDEENKLEIKLTKGSVVATNIINAFKNRVAADGGTFEGESNLSLTLNSLIDTPNEVFTFNYNVVALCEIKYTPVVCSFINQKGGWEFLTFFKAQTESMSIENTSFRLNAASINYDPLTGQTKNFNTNGSKPIKLNTGWIEQVQNKTIEELMLSETILLDNKPFSLATKQLAFKTDLVDKNINYTIDFTPNFELINNVV
tara:strand:+ start:861 stop:2045 length:1185 start_codon:yes stop_codon:yes gene_type:complete